MKQYKLPSGAYTALKWAGLVACPAIATFVGVLVGALVGYSAATAKEVGA